MATADPAAAPPRPAAQGGGGGARRVMTQPINVVFRHLQQRQRVQVWLFGQTDMRVEGRVAGFDEYMNLVLDDAEEVFLPTKGKGKSGKESGGGGKEGDEAAAAPAPAPAAPVRRNQLGRILLKGDTITLMQPAPSA